MKILVFMLVGISIIFFSWARGPFESVLPEEEAKEPTQQRRFQERVSLPDWVVVEAVLWGSDSPQTIINSEVYYVGDKIKDLDAAIFKIKENIVYISYSGKIFKKEVKKREAR
ncbi:MAG: hypothetical protein K9L80_00190 [Candidatus Omnitrophica bacterium]|nr:hypothetical protein [Candidatus Omnitrophota bacterium]MCF7887959.1 hypothetical protein [Candidatus Omnitrophota bacterium]